MPIDPHAPLKTFLVTDFRKRFADILDEVHREPVILSRYHEDVAILMSKNHYERLQARTDPNTAVEDVLITAYMTHLINNWDRIRDLLRQEVASGQTPEDLQDLDAVMRGIRVLKRFQVEKAIAEAPTHRNRSGPPRGTIPEQAAAARRKKAP